MFLVIPLELIIPILNALKKCSPGLVTGYIRDNDMKLVELHVFPGIMNWALMFVWPVVSLDAAHLRSRYKGTLYVASVPTGCNDIFPLGFMISAGNEGRDTWKKMLQLLIEACWIIDDQGYGNTDTDGVVRPPATFIHFRPRQGSETSIESGIPKQIWNELCKAHWSKCGAKVWNVVCKVCVFNCKDILYTGFKLLISWDLKGETRSGSMSGQLNRIWWALAEHSVVLWFNTPWTAYTSKVWTCNIKHKWVSKQYVHRSQGSWMAG